MFYKFIVLPILLSSFLFSGIVLDIGIISQGNGTYDDGEMYDYANLNGMKDAGETVYDDRL